MANLIDQLSAAQLSLAQEKIAQYSVQGVDLPQVCQILGLPNVLVLEIMARDEYKALACTMEQVQAEKVENLSATWNDVEVRSLEIVNKHLTNCQDPEFAFKIAQGANKAVRRSLGEAGGAGASGGLTNKQEEKTLIINLQANYIDHLQLNTQLIIDKSGQGKEVLEQSVVNVLPAKAVDVLLADKNHMHAETLEKLKAPHE